jgi:glutamate racemase
VGIAATESTILSDAYARTLRRLAPDLRVDSLACPLFVPLVEEGWHDDPIAEQIAHRYLDPLLAAGIDTLVLGCTHYPLLAPTLRRVVGGEIALVDSAETMAEVVAAGLERGGLLEPAGDPVVHVCVTDAGERLARLARRILGRDSVSLELVDVSG